MESPKFKVKEVHQVPWYAFYDALQPVHRSCDALVSYFSKADTASKAKGLLKKITSFQLLESCTWWWMLSLGWRSYLSISKYELFIIFHLKFDEKTELNFYFDTQNQRWLILLYFIITITEEGFVCIINWDNRSRNTKKKEDDRPNLSKFLSAVKAIDDTEFMHQGHNLTNCSIVIQNKFERERKMFLQGLVDNTNRRLSIDKKYFAYV